MNFTSELNTIIKTIEINDIRNSKNITAALTKQIVTEEDLIQFSQFKYLLEMGSDNFIYEMVLGAKENDLLFRVEQIVQMFNAYEVSPQIYSYYLYSTLQALAVKSDRVVWLDPFINDLKDGYGLFHKTFATGLYHESLEDYVIVKNVLTGFAKDKKYMTIPLGVESIDDMILSGNSNLEFITLPESLSALPMGMLGNCNRLKTVIMPSTIKIITQNFCKGAKNLNLVVASGATEIQEYAFEDTSISNINFVGNNRIETIGKFAFKNCNNLKKIDLSNSKFVDKYAFNNCKGITDISLTLTEQMIKDNSKFYNIFEKEIVDFKRYVELTNVTIKVPKGILPTGYFEGCENLKSIKIIGELKQIGARAFKGCENLTNLEMNFIGDTLDSEVFCGCTHLEYLPAFNTVKVLNDSVFKECHSINGLKFKTIDTLGQRVFEDCTQLSSIEFIYVNEILPEFTFSGCFALRDFSFLEDVSILAPYSLAKIIFNDLFEIPSNIKGICTNAFDSCVFEKGLLISDKCKINTNSFSNVTKIPSVVFESINIVDMNDKKIEPFMIFEHRIENFNHNLKNLTSVQVNDNYLPENAFRGWTNITNVVLYSDVHEIPKCCFENCLSLKTVYIESEEFSLGDKAFANCISLKHLEAAQSTIDFKNLYTIDLSLTTNLGVDVFNSCINVERICVPICEDSTKNKFRVHSLFEKDIVNMNPTKYNNLHTVILNLETGIVPNNLFEGCDKLKIIEVNGDVTQLGEGFFKNCTNLVKIKMNYTGTVIPKDCYKNCYSLIELSPYASVVSIEDDAFAGCTSLNRVEFLSPIKSLGKSSFEGCEKLKQVKMDLKAELLPTNCFKGCVSIENFNFLHNIVKVDSYALADVVFPSGFIVPAKIEYIESYAFANTTFVTTLSLPAAKYMDQLSFVNAKGFNRIEFRNLDIIDTHNVKILPYTIFTDSLQDFNNRYSCIDAVLIRTNHICDSAFKDWHFLRSVVATPEVNKIPDSCFDSCIHLQQVKMPYWDMEFGYHAFKDCNALSSMTFTELNNSSREKKLVPSRMFNNCVNLSSIHITIDDTVIKEGMKFYSFFENDLDTFNELYTKVSSVTVKNNVKRLPKSFFEGCININKINIIDDVEVLESKSFAGCENLQELRMNYTGILIPEECFLKCERLPKITNLANVKIIEDRAFKFCTSLTAIQFKTPIESMGEKAFSQCSNLEKINMYYIGEKLPAMCFANCEGLLITPIFLNLKDVDVSSFVGCLNLDHVYINAVPNMTFNQIFSSSKRINKVSYTSTVVPENYFNSAINIEEVDFTQKVSSIGEYAFANVSSIKTIKNLSYVETIGNYAFANSGLEYIRISPRTMFMGTGIFAGCERLREVEMPVRYMYAGILFDDMNGNSSKKIIQKNHDVCKEYSIPTSLEIITINDGKLHPGVFSGMQVSVKVEYNIKHIPDYAFYDCNQIYFENTKIIESIGEYALSYVAIKDANFINVSKVSDYALCGTSIVNLEFGRNLKTISTKSLLDAKVEDFRLTSNPNFMFVNEMLVNLDKGVIVHTNKLIGDVVIPDSVTKLESFTFVNCDEVTKITTNRVNTIQTDAFVNCGNLSNVILDKNVVTCEKAIFKNCNSINELTLNFLGKDRKTPKDLSYLFNNFGEEVCMKSITILNGDLSEEPFKDCAVIENLNISKLNVNVLKDGVFKNILFNTIHLPDSLDKVSENAFDNSIAKEVISSGRKVNVVDQCIYNGRQLIYCHIDKADDIVIGKDIIEISPTAFRNTTSIGELTIENNSLKINNAFDKVDSLEGIVVGDVPLNISSMFAGAFTKIKNVTYTGSNPRKGLFDELCLFAELNLPNIEEMVDGYLDVTSNKKILIECLNIGSKLNKLDIKIFDYLDVANINIENNKNYKTYNNMLVDVKENAIVYAANNLDSNVVIDFNVNEIKDSVFAENDNLRAIDTGNVQVIGNEAFRDCCNLKDVNITNKCTLIGENILKRCDKISSIIVPYVGRSIDDCKPFEYLFGISHPNLLIKSVTVTNQKVINGTFAETKNVQRIVLSEGTKEIKARSFENAINLNEIFIPKSLTKVEEAIFFKCKKKINIYVDYKEQVDAWSKDWRKTKAIHVFSNIKIQPLKSRN